MFTGRESLDEGDHLSVIHAAFINTFFFFMLAMVTHSSVTMQQIQVMNMSHSLHPPIYMVSHVAKVCRLVGNAVCGRAVCVCVCVFRIYQFPCLINTGWL